ncbi:hypothetical protein [Methylorubrum extorquens]
MIAATVPRDRLTRLAFTGEPHLRPIYAAMLDGRRSLLLLPQHGGRFPVSSRPFVALLGDDADTALGPAAFHGGSLGRLAGSARGVALVSYAVMPGVYAIAAEMVRLGHSTVIVETPPRVKASGWPSCAPPRPAHPS